MDLTSEATGYLEAERYEVDERSHELIGERTTTGGHREQIFLWTIDPSAPFEPETWRLLRRIDEIDEAYPRAQKCLLVPSREGLRDGRARVKVRLNRRGSFYQERDSALRDQRR